MADQKDDETNPEEQKPFTEEMADAISPTSEDQATEDKTLMEEMADSIEPDGSEPEIIPTESKGDKKD